MPSTILHQIYSDSDSAQPTNFSNGDQAVENLRIPPQALEAERSLLGGLMLDNSAWDRIGDIIVADDFYRSEHRVVYQVLDKLIRHDKAADVITVDAELRNIGQGSDNNIQFLNNLVQTVPNAANIRSYAEIVKKMATLRRLITVSDEIASNAYVADTKGRDVEKILDSAETKILQIRENSARMKQGFQSIELLSHELMRVIEHRSRNRAHVTGVPTGFVDFDRMTSGMQEGDLIVLAARPSMGKTALALNIAEHVATTGELPVMVFSMEMSASQLAMRVLGSMSMVDQSKLRTGDLSQEEWASLTQAMSVLNNSDPKAKSRVDLLIDETPNLTSSELRANARRLARKFGKVGLIVVDYLQLMSSGSSREDNRATELGEISRGLKSLAKELKCPVLALSQLNRGVESRVDKRPLLSDLRESGAIEQDADIIMFIYREDYYNKEIQNDNSEAEIIIGKHRNGPTGTFKLQFSKSLTRFRNLATGSDSAGTVGAVVVPTQPPSAKALPSPSGVKSLPAPRAGKPPGHR